jgi:hypothetical protein
MADFGEVLAHVRRHRATLEEVMTNIAELQLVAAEIDSAVTQLSGAPTVTQIDANDQAVLDQVGATLASAAGKLQALANPAPAAAAEPTA